MRANKASADPQVFPAVYYATDSHGKTYSSTMRRHVSCAVIATYPAHPEHVFCGQIVKAVAGGRSASFASDERIAHKSAAHAAKQFRATDVEVVPAIRAADPKP
jgi:hypothetical protein